MRHKIYFLTIVIICWQHVLLPAEENGTLQLTLLHYDVGDGLLSNEVQEISQDDKGFIWCATNNGLSRFDGYEFMNFRSSYDRPDYFSSNTILDMMEKDDMIWLVTPNGVDVFDKTTAMVRHLKDSGLVNASIKCTLPLGEGHVLLGGLDGLFVYDASTEIVTDMNFDKLSHVRELYRDSHGYIWVGTWKCGIFRLSYESRKLEKVQSRSIPEDLAVTRFFEDCEGNMYFTTWGDGLYCLKDFYSGNMKVINYTLPKLDYSHLDWNIIYDADFDKEGNLWLGSPGGIRIVTLDDDVFVERTYVLDTGGENIGLHEIWSVFCGTDGTIWLSDYGGGVMAVRAARTDIQEFNFKKFGLSSSAVTSIFRTSDDVFMFGIRGTGVLAVDMTKDEVIRYPVFDLLDKESNAVVSFVDVPECQSLFLAMRYFGIYQVRLADGRPVSMEHFDVENGSLRNNFTNAAVRDGDGNVWVGTNAGVVVLIRSDGGIYEMKEPEPVNDVLNYAYVETLYSDKEGNIWIGGGETGLFRFKFDGEENISDVAIYSVGNGKMNNNRVTALYEDSSGRFWVGTHGGGLSLYDEGSDAFEVIEDMYLFPSDVISSITEDHNGMLWVSTANGFLCYNPDRMGKVVRNFGAGNELKNLSFIKNAVWTDGFNVIFGGYDGISVFNPDNLKDLGEIMSPSIIDIQIFNKSVFDSSDSNRTKVIDRIPPYSSCIDIGYLDKSISIKFASPVYGDNNILTKYAYRLDGLEKDWNYVNSKQRTVTYSNLRPGTYNFMVRATNEGGKWISEPATVAIKVSPAPWMTWWARLLYAAASAVILLMTYFTVKNRIKLREALKIEQLERLKSEEVNNAKLVFFTNVSHELFTPITIMSCSLDKLLEKEGADTSLHRIIRANLNRLMRLLQQILEFRKAESSNLKLKVSNVDIIAFIKKICDENFAPMINDKNIRLIFSASENQMKGYIDKDKLDKILYNLLSNAYKYNRQDGRVFVDISSAELNGFNSVSISVKDTGYGISQQKQTNLFKRFYEGDYRKFNTKGTGIGLSLTRDLVLLHNGKIEVESKEGEGALFRVILPISENAYSKEQIESDINDGPECGNMRLTRGVINESNPTNAGDVATVLLVEDNSELLFVMQNILGSKYNILTAGNGKVAMEVLRQQAVDLIITDYVMPEMDGVELSREIRSELSLSHLPVIMLSAKSEVESKLESYEAGVDAFVAKPFDVQLLIAQVDGMLENRKRLYENFRSGNDAEMNLLINTDLDKKFIEKVIRLIEEHISEPEFNIDAFNEAMNMSNSTLYRKIKGLTGMSPKEFVRNIRFKYASRLLLEQTTNISEVAFMTGFSDAKYFSQCFKKEFGVTPTQYIRRSKEKT